MADALTTTRLQRVTQLLVRHVRLVNTQGECIGCLCGACEGRGRLNHLRHLARVIDAFIESEAAS